MINLAATFLLALVRRIRRGGVIINEHTLTKTQTRFHVRVLSRWFDLIKLADLPQRLARPTRRPFCLLTFDDGKRSNFTETAPELERLRVPAVFYVTTDPLTTGSCLWFDRRDQLISAIGHCPAGLELDSLKQLPFDLLMDRLERACTTYGFKPQDESSEQRPMSWEEAHSLSRRGFTIGAHGLTHAILTRETRKRAFAEIEESLARVTCEVGTPCTTFAFPNGNYNSELTQHALLCGVRTVMTADPMWVDERAALWRLPRVQLFGSASRARIETKIALAAFKGALANPNGSGRHGRRAMQSEGGALPTAVSVP
jgi:peptidoglycan/xylan/chitin deacetylase (PgdA/CDA1 family)